MILRQLTLQVDASIVTLNSLDLLARDSAHICCAPVGSQTAAALHLIPRSCTSDVLSLLNKKGQPASVKVHAARYLTSLLGHHRCQRDTFR